MQEFDQKQARLQAMLEKSRCEALLLQRVSSFAWATCGAASYVNTAGTNGAAGLLITPSGRYLITDNIEAPRLEAEEHLSEQGWDFRIAPWHEASSDIADLTRGLRLAADGPYPGALDLAPEIARLRANLTPEEGDRFRLLGRLCAEALQAAAMAARPGLTEREIAGRLAMEAESRGVQAVVNLIASDERIFRFRHPLPTDRTLERYLMLVLCGRKWGLVCSITRFVHFGALPGELLRKSEAVARVDAVLINSTRPGQVLAEPFRRGMSAYAAEGYPDEWRHHHQGGMTGYEPREVIASPDAPEIINTGQVFAWNPSISGAKSEDSVLITPGAPEILTAIPGWPTIDIPIEGLRLSRPAILERS